MAAASLGLQERERVDADAGSKVAARLSGCEGGELRRAVFVWRRCVCACSEVCAWRSAQWACNSDLAEAGGGREEEAVEKEEENEKEEEGEVGREGGCCKKTERASLYLLQG